jgi:Na+-translocating ferredoxin:NAD+ oxidoreductase RnfC subunit
MDNNRYLTGRLVREYVSTVHTTLRTLDPAGVTRRIREAGITGAGGSGFPAYAKWRRLDEVDHLLVNHQESEPNCYLDKWLGREYAPQLAGLFEALLDTCLESVVIGAKRSDRDPWLRPLEVATDGTVHEPADLPLDVSETAGVTFAYTGPQYEHGMEDVLLRVVAGTVLGRDLPTDRGWIVHNTETLYNVYRALAEGAPTIRTYLQVDGRRPDGRPVEHELIEAPVGTPAGTILEAAGVDPTTLSDECVLADGGPGWCFEIERPPAAFGVRKRTNCLLLLEKALAAANTYANGRIDVRDPVDWGPEAPTATPTRTVRPSRLRVPIDTDRSFGGLTAPSKPVVEAGDRVAPGDPLAVPVDDGCSVTHHAPVPAAVTDVTPTEIALRHTGR